MSFTQMPEIYPKLGTLEPEVSNIKPITGTVSTNQIAIATVVVVCDDKKYTIQLHQPKTTRLYADSIAKSEESEKISYKVSKIFL